MIDVHQNISCSDFKKILKTTKKYIDILAKQGITSPEDLLLYFPRTYEDRRNLKMLSQLYPNDGEKQTVKGKITKKGIFTTPKGKKLITIEFHDEEGTKGIIQVLNNKYILKSTKINQWYFIIGKPKWNGKIFSFRYPELIEAEETDQESFNYGRIYPIYAEMQGIKPHRFAKKIFEIYQNKKTSFPEYLPSSFLQKYNLVDKETMIHNLHFPNTLEDANKAKYRLFFEMLLKIQLNSLINKKKYQKFLNINEKVDRNIIRQFLTTLPFTLTQAQKKVIKELIDDLYSGKTMMRLLQGDVGSGKTIVAVVVAYYIIKKIKGQVAFLVPIAVLAQQHYRNIAKILLPLGIRVEMIIGSSTNKEKQRIKKGLISGEIDFIIGTHALIQDNIYFDNLKFALIDEQHKFGVKQRSFFQNHNSPHILQMTATPIPRSLALAFFGEFDVSIIDEMPVGRKPIITKILNEKEFLKLKPWILTKISQGQKVFLITPLIEESETLDEVKSAVNFYHEISQLYTETSIGLLHGKLNTKDKDSIMDKFKNGECMILVATTVIEVGIDIPEATIMIIMNAERFGISQLHQLRGRVGRSNIQSYCFLETKKKSGESYQRLKHLENTTDGFQLAEIDMQVRGTGEILGIKQAGATDIPLDILSNNEFIKEVAGASKRLLENEPKLVKTKILNNKEKNIMLV